MGKSLATAGAVFVALVASVATQQPIPPASQPPATAPAPGGHGPQPIVPVAASTLAANPDRYVGSTVSVTAAVDQRLGDTAFSVDQDRTGTDGHDVLVLAPLLTAPVQRDAYVTVIGEVVRFDPAVVSAKMKAAAPSLAPDVAAKYRGRPAIIASSVINGSMTDLAKKLPPPMRPEELGLNKAMKQIGPGFTALRQAAAASSVADAGAQAAVLKTGFTQAAQFWKATAKPDAIQWTADALRASDEIATASARGDLEAVKAAVPKLQQICSSCHNTYRERLDDGSYRYKGAAK